ncbi:unnamed protein product [Malus baccata var. baccata]
MMESSQSTVSAQHGLTQNEPHKATVTSPPGADHFPSPLHHRSTIFEEEVETTGCAIYQPNQPIILAEPIFDNRKKTVG